MPSYTSCIFNLFIFTVCYSTCTTPLAKNTYIHIKVTIRRKYKKVQKQVLHNRPPTNNKPSHGKVQSTQQLNRHCIRRFFKRFGQCGTRINNRDLEKPECLTKV